MNVESSKFERDYMFHKDLFRTSESITRFQKIEEVLEIRSFEHYHQIIDITQVKHFSPVTLSVTLKKDQLFIHHGSLFPSIKDKESNLQFIQTITKSYISFLLKIFRLFPTVFSMDTYIFLTELLFIPDLLVSLHLGPHTYSVTKRFSPVEILKLLSSLEKESSVVQQDFAALVIISSNTVMTPKNKLIVGRTIIEFSNTQVPAIKIVI